MSETKNVSKALKCSDIRYGFAEYKCETCGESTKVPFTFKSKVCNRCGRLYTARAAIAEYRIIKYENGRVTLWY